MTLSANILTRRCLILRSAVVLAAQSGPAGAASQLESEPGAFVHVYDAWFACLRERDADAAAALYAEDAVLESPLRLICEPAPAPEHSGGTGVVSGRAAIRRLLAEALRRAPQALSCDYRTGVFFVNGDWIAWETPRRTPTTEQSDRIDLMEIDRGLIRTHRMYGGWRGVQALLSAGAHTPGSP